MPREALAAWPALTGRQVEQAGPEAIPALRDLYVAEPVRFLRPREDWEWAMQCRVVMNRPSDFWLVRQADGLPLAYAIIQRPGTERRPSPELGRAARLAEWAGDRGALLDALPALAAHYQVDVLFLPVREGDLAAQALLAARGCTEAVPRLSYTLRVINFPQLLGRLRPLLAERLGQEEAERWEFAAAGGPATSDGPFFFRRGEEQIAVESLGALARFLFGSGPGAQPEDPPPSGPQRLLDILSAALPLPTLWYGINYV